MKENHLRPVQPGWVIVPTKQDHPNEWYHLVGWEEREPVIAYAEGVCAWHEIFGEDRFCVATLDEWQGSGRAPTLDTTPVLEVVESEPGITTSKLWRRLHEEYGVENHGVIIAQAAFLKQITRKRRGKATEHYPC